MIKGIVSLIGVLLLAGCGGGSSSSSGDDGGAGTPEASARITADNARGYGAYSLAMSELAIEQTDNLMDDSDPTRSIGTAPSLVGSGDLALYAKSARATINDSAACDSGQGTMSTTFYDRDDSADLSSGDAFRVGFDACVIGDWTIDGWDHIEYQSLMLGGTPWHVRYSNPFDLHLSASGVDVYTDGSIALDFSSPSTGEFAAAISADQYRYLGITNRGRLEIAVYDMDAAWTGSQNSNAYSYSLDFVFEAPQGVVEVETTEVFEGNFGSHPYQGQMVVRGGEGAARFTAIDPTSVRMEVDADGDGSYEYAETIAWSEFSVSLL